MRALQAIVGAAQHVLDRKIDEAAGSDEAQPVGQLVLAALVLEALRIWLRLLQEDVAESGPHLHIDGSTGLNCAASCEHYGSDYGPN